jgi:DNA-binding PadR family transcriptional regulator
MGNEPEWAPEALYRLTPNGRRKLVPLRQEWAELFNALQQLSEVANA